MSYRYNSHSRSTVARSNRTSTPTPAQFDYLRRLRAEVGEDVWRDAVAAVLGVNPFTGGAADRMNRGSASRLIDLLKKGGGVG